MGSCLRCLFISSVIQICLVDVYITVAPIVYGGAEETVEGHPHIFCSASAFDGDDRAPSAEAAIVVVGLDIAEEAELFVLAYLVHIVYCALCEVGAAEEVTLIAYLDGGAARLLLVSGLVNKGVSFEG